MDRQLSKVSGVSTDMNKVAIECYKSRYAYYIYNIVELCLLNKMFFKINLFLCNVLI